MTIRPLGQADCAHGCFIQLVCCQNVCSAARLRVGYLANMPSAFNSHKTSMLNSRTYITHCVADMLDCGSDISILVLVCPLLRAQLVLREFLRPEPQRNLLRR